MFTLSIRSIFAFLKGPGTPWGLNASNVGATQVTLEWKEPELMTKEGLSYRVSFTKAIRGCET